MKQGLFLLHSTVQHPDLRRRNILRIPKKFIILKMANTKVKKWKKPDKDHSGATRELIKGYMMLGEECKIEGGLTLDFRAKNVFFYVLKAVDLFCYQLVSYRDKKHSKKKGAEPVRTIRYTGRVLTHQFVIGQTSSQKEVIFVVIHAQQPTYFKPDQKQAEKWFQEFSKVSRYSKEKELSRGAVVNTKQPPINAPERYTPKTNRQFVGDYVTLRSEPGPKQSPEATGSKLTGQVPSPSSGTKPSRNKSNPALSTTAGKHGNAANNTHIKQNGSMGQLPDTRGFQTQERRTPQDDGIFNRKGHANKQAEKSPSSTSDLSKVSRTQPRSINDDEESLLSMYAPSEVIFDIHPWKFDDDDGDDHGEEDSMSPRIPNARKPVKRGRSLRRRRENGKFAWDLTDTIDEVDTATPAAPVKMHTGLPNSHDQDTDRTKPSYLSTKLGQYCGTPQQLVRKIEELKDRPLPVPPGESRQIYVSMKSSTQRVVTTGMGSSSLNPAVDISTGRRRSISDPLDPEALLRSMGSIGIGAGSSGGWQVEPGKFYRQNEGHESIWSSEHGSTPEYVRPTALGDILSGHDRKAHTIGAYGRPGLDQTMVPSRNPKDPLPVPIKVVRPAQSWSPKTRPDLPYSVYDYRHGAYDEISSVLSSRQLIEMVTHEQNTGPVNVELKKHDVNNGVVFVELKSRIWIASWKREVNGKAKFHKTLHIGDELASVNGKDVRNVKHTAELISSSSGDLVKLHINRMPLAKVVYLTKSITDTWGCEFSRNELTKMYTGPLKDSGIAETPYGLNGKETKWVVTECHHQPVPIMTCQKDEVKNRMFMSNTELPLVLHPKDFIDSLVAMLKRNQKIIKHTSDYQI
ncbi:uncharacterized protein LOC121425570 [Lytechinus variegatus]|uniref:uncharacterized protein LOC121425570 n=1 Tax=Lytechinus variegatus TaxID=7654 RepID=UPI001BB17875|nr:uncharacterized protein LOC121425570 [Lytechinus variegatus]